MELELKYRKNYLSVDKQTAMSSYGEFFEVGEKVTHDDKNVGSAIIISFEMNEDINEIRVITDKGYAGLDFLIKIKNEKQ